ncbi:uncharacterized protein LOC127264424 [Andrographis paniculata]|uniref:uncharacterized protein LOC127264424 n=1 Tax=Andrographis paniculata TaxID=175694 RepID=UPI0021E84CC4|nr:uncharacterized protein LOC127264424 [Andrographis paniculata]
MIRTINPCAAAKTAEIMSRYRPIAPKPEVASQENDGSALPDGIKKSPYLRNVWANMQARPTRTRKRGRTAAFAAPPPPVRRTRACLQGLAPPYQIGDSPARNLAMHGFNRPAGVQPEIPIYRNLIPLKCGLDTAVTTLSESVSLPVICPAPPRTPRSGSGKEISIDLNTTAAAAPAAAQSPEELDFMAQLYEPVKPAVISPKPVRPVGSSITVMSIHDDTGVNTAVSAEDVEALVEAEEAPVIISDSRNKVRLTNSAFKEMVGQPECPWLDCAGGGTGGRSRRIGGEVVLQFSGSEPRLETRTGFRCRVKIEWETDGEKKSLDSICRCVRCTCRQGKDYQFLWRIHDEDEVPTLEI